MGSSHIPPSCQSHLDTGIFHGEKNPQTLWFYGETFIILYFCFQVSFSKILHNMDKEKKKKNYLHNINCLKASPSDTEDLYFSPL